MAIATDCIESIEDVLRTIPGLEKRVFHVYSDEELIERTKGLSFPCVGVVYDGLMGREEPGATGKLSSTADLVVSIMLFFRQNTRATTDPKDTTVETLDTIRSKILETRAPSGHLWKFQLEAAVEGKQGLLTYVQRWATPVQLVGRKA